MNLGKVFFFWEKQRRRKFHLEVLDAIYSKYGKQNYLETRGRKRNFMEMEKVEKREKKKRDTDCYPGSDSGSSSDDDKPLSYELINQTHE